MDVKVKVIRSYNDLLLKKYITKDKELIVSRERADVLSTKGLVEVIEPIKEKKEVKKAVRPKKKQEKAIRKTK